MNRIVLLLVLGVILIAGCKKNKDTPPDSAPPPATQTPSPNPSAGGGIVPAGGVGVVVNPSAALGGGGGGGALMGAVKAGRRAKAQSELNQLALFIEQLRDPFGKMPTKEEIMADLQRSAPPIFNAIQEGSFILTGTKDPSGLWAYEVDADKHDGLAVIGGRANRSTTDEVKKYLGMK